jgi:hypothetical protein
MVTDKGCDCDICSRPYTDEIKQTVDLISKYLKEDWYLETKDYLLITNVRTASYKTLICAFNIEQAINDFIINGLITFDVAEDLKANIAKELEENNTEKIEIGQEFNCTDMHDIEYIVSLVGKRDKAKTTRARNKQKELGEKTALERFLEKTDQEIQADWEEAKRKAKLEVDPYIDEHF